MSTSNGPDATEPVRWSALASWKQFIWLFMFCSIAASRAGLLLIAGDQGWIVWAGGAVLLLFCIAALRNWARYILTSSRVVVRNGFTGREIRGVSVSEITDVVIDQGPVARLGDIGTIVVRTAKDPQALLLRGVKSPETVKARLDALRP